MLRRDPGPSTVGRKVAATNRATQVPPTGMRICVRSEEHTSELQSHLNLVCRLLLEKKKKKVKNKVADEHRMDSKDQSKERCEVVVSKCAMSDHSVLLMSALRNSVNHTW